MALGLDANARLLGSSMIKDTMLLMGAGDIAQRLQPLLSAHGHEVIGARRNPPQQTHFPHIRADARDVKDWRQLLAKQPAVIVVTLVPTAFTDEGYLQGYVEPVEALLKALNEGEAGYRPLLVFVSSTSVYSEREGEWVDETTPAQPKSFSGMRLLQAEDMLRSAAYPHTIVRFSGIYGPGRDGMLKRLRSGQLTLTPAWTNRIHVDDCAGVLAHLIQRYHAGFELNELYLATDNLPVRQSELMRGLAARMAIDITSLPISDTIGPRGSKRCSNQRLTASGYRLRYPTWKEGYATR